MAGIINIWMDYESMQEKGIRQPGWAFTDVLSGVLWAQAEVEAGMEEGLGGESKGLGQPLGSQAVPVSLEGLEDPPGQRKGLLLHKNRSLH